GVGGSVFGGFGEQVLGGVGGSVLGGFGEQVLGGVGGSVFGGFGEQVLGGVGGSVLGGFGEQVLGGVGGSVFGGFGEQVPGGIGGSVLGGVHVGEPQFDAAKAVFNLTDSNRDGVNSQEEFHQWAQGGVQNVGGQSHSIYPTEATAAITTINNENNLYRPQGTPGLTPGVANILEQSGLSRFV
ncbi:unnamed protein product, partial [Rotaria sp. Silwood2]